MNKVFLLGNVGKDLEIRQAGKSSVCTINLATSKVWYNKDGKKQEHTEWHRVEVWGRNADNAVKYLSKGSKILVEGEIQTRQWKHKSGETRWSTQVLCTEMTYISTKSKQEESPPTPDYKDVGDDDIPF